jgi:hypothetical protein
MQNKEECVGKKNKKKNKIVYSAFDPVENNSFIL